MNKEYRIKYKGHKTAKLCEEIQDQRINSEKKVVVQCIQEYMKDKFGNKVLPSQVIDEMVDIVISRNGFYAHVQDDIAALGAISLLAIQKNIDLSEDQIELALAKYKCNEYHRTKIELEEMGQILKEVQKIKEI